MQTKIKTSYPDVIVNAFKSVQAWKSLALVLLGALFFETIMLGWVAGQRTVILVPQHLASAKVPITLNIGQPFAPDYLTGVAKGDLAYLLDWTPENIETQYALFLGRLAANVYVAQKEVLLNESRLHREEGVTQSFYVTRSTISGHTATLHGILVRAVGGREVFRGPATYALSYINAGNGLLQLAGVTQPSANDRANRIPANLPDANAGR